MSNQLTASEVATLEAAGCQVGPGGPARAYPPISGGIVEAALPRGADADYVAKMVAKADGGQRPSSGASTDYTGRLPAITGALEGWSKSGTVRAPSALRPGDTISFMGTRVEVEHAVREGLIERDAGTGGYRSPSTQDRAHVEAQDRRATAQQAAADATELVALRQSGEELPQSAQAVVDAVVARADGAAVENVLRELVGSGDVTGATLAQAGMSAGYTASQSMEAYNTVYAGFRQQADTCAVAQGVPREALDGLWDWCAETDAGGHKFAINSLIRGGGTAGIKALAKGYVAHLRATA